MIQFKNILFLTVLLTSISLFSQKKDKVEYLSTFDKKTVRWGFHLGLNSIDYKVSYKTDIPEAIDRITVTPSVGFNVGLLGDLRLHKNINIRLEPGVAYSSKKILYEYLSDENKARDAVSTYLYVPLLVQFSTNRYKNVRPFVAAGVAYGHNFTSNYNSDDDNASNVFRLQKNNYFYEIGVGMDFYFFYFKFSPSIRGVFAINNELQRDFNDIDPNRFSYWTTPIDYLGSRGVFLRFAFQ